MFLKLSGRNCPVDRYLLNKCISSLTNVLTSSFPQSMIARLVLNLLKSRETIAMLQWSKAFDAFPLWQSRIFLNVQTQYMFNVTNFNRFLLVAFLACNAFYFNLAYNRFTHNTFYTQSKRLLPTIIHCSLYTESSFVCGRSAA